MKFTLGIALLATAFACGGGDDDGDGTQTPDAASGVTFDASQNTPDAMPTPTVDAMPAGNFTLTSTAYADGGVIPRGHSCQGDNISPALAWENPPAGTQSYALVFIDVSTNFLHSVMWDIPMSNASLPEDVDQAFEPADVPGAKQARSYLGSRGYAGPCPGSEHNYEFRLHALNVETLSGLSQASTGSAAQSAIRAASIESAVLLGSFDPNP